MRRRPYRSQPASEPHATTSRSRSDSPTEHAPTSELERLIFLSDGVFAIAMTLLAVELALPEVTSESTADLGHRLLALGPRYFSYALSFLVIASYWRSHQRTFRYIVRLDSRFVWLNLLLLMCIAFLPFPTSLLGNYASDVAAVSLYAGTLAITGLVVLGMWVYATQDHRLTTRDLTAGQIHHFIARALCAPVFFAVSIGIAQFNTDAAKYTWLAIAVAMNALGWYFRDAS
jgi:uncharacterized membrane protein